MGCYGGPYVLGSDDPVLPVVSRHPHNDNKRYKNISVYAVPGLLTVRLKVSVRQTLRLSLHTATGALVGPHTTVITDPGVKIFNWSVARVTGIHFLKVKAGQDIQIFKLIFME